MKKLVTFTFILFSFFAKADYWTQKADFGGGGRAFDCSFSIGNKGYIGCGMDSALNPQNDFWEYDQAANVWTQKANFGGAPRNGATGFSIGARGYIGTGSVMGVLQQDFWEWDQATNTWTQKANFGGSARYGAAGFSIGAKGYISIGFDNPLPQDLWEWDQTTNIWTQKANFGGTGRWLAVAFTIGTKGYIGTGVNSSSGLLNDFWEWDQSNNLWTQKSSFSVGRCEALGFSIGNYGFIGAGSIDWGLIDTNDLWQYNTANNTWTQVANFGAGQRELAVGFSIGCKGYFSTGIINDLNYHDDLWEYTPNSYVCATGIEELPTSVLDFTLSPNPAKEYIAIYIPNLRDLEYIAITDAQGKKVYETKLMTSNLKLQTSNFSKGIYFVEVRNGKQKAIKKFIKE